MSEQAVAPHLAVDESEHSSRCKSPEDKLDDASWAFEGVWARNEPSLADLVTSVNRLP